MKITEATKQRLNKIIKRKKLKWGIAGCGNFAENAVMPGLEDIKRSQIVSVYSHDLNRAKALANKFSVPGAFNDYNEFLKSDFDIVYIGSRNSDHYKQVLEAAKAGKHILCEKPPAMNSKEAAEMAKVCASNSVILSYNYVHRFHPISRKTNEIITRGYIGKIVSVKASFDIDYAPDANFRFKSEQSGGGAMRDLGTHMIDLLRYIGGEITDAKGFTDNIIYNSEVDDFGGGIVHFEKGGYGLFTCSFSAKRGINKVEITGHKGTLVIDGLIGGRDKSVKLSINLTGEANKSFRRRGNKLNFRLRDLQNSMLQGKIPEVTGEDGYKNMLIIEKIENAG